MNKEHIWSKARTLGELAAYYGVDKRTFRKWLSCQTLRHIRPEIGRFFSINQVKSIIKHLGINEEIEIQTPPETPAADPKHP